MGATQSRGSPKGQSEAEAQHGCNPHPPTLKDNSFGPQPRTHLARNNYNDKDPQALVPNRNSVMDDETVPIGTGSMIQFQSTSKKIRCCQTRETVPIGTQLWTMKLSQKEPAP